MQDQAYGGVLNVNLELLIARCFTDEQFIEAASGIPISQEGEYTMNRYSASVIY